MNKFKQLKIILACVCVLFSLPSYAEIVPTPAQADARIRHQSYNANDVTAIQASYGYVTSISFSKDEEILDITSGFAEGWNITKSSGNDHILYIKPIPINQNGAIVLPTVQDWATNIIVTTNKRMYVFQAIYVEPEKREMFYVVNFNYPEDEQKQRALEAQNRLLERKKAEELERLEREQQKLVEALNSPPTPRNWNFTAKVNAGSQSIMPDYAYDDGANTYLGFARSKSIPSVFIFDNGEEMLTSTSMRQDNNNFVVLVVHGINPVLYLRSGQKLVGVFNKGYGVQEYPYETTTIDNVERVLINE